MIWKICEITSDELIFGGFNPLGTTVQKGGVAAQMSFAHAHVRSSAFAFTYCKCENQKNKEYVRRVWGFFEKNINDYLLVTKPIAHSVKSNSTSV